MNETEQTKANVARRTIEGWTLDKHGRANVHTDVVLKAVKACLFWLGDPEMQKEEQDYLNEESG